jgi:cell division protein FtsI (penicillin-binding protein 3)
MAVDRENIISRYFIVILIMILCAVGVIIKAGVIMFGERQYWKEVGDRFVRDSVIDPPHRGNILSTDGKLMSSSLPEYEIFMDFLAGSKTKDSLLIKDSILMDSLQIICKGLHRIFPDKSAAYFEKHLLKGRAEGSEHYQIYPERISYRQYKKVKQLPVFNMGKYEGGFHYLDYPRREKLFGSLAARTLGDLRSNTTTEIAKNGIELAFDSVLRGKNGIAHRQKIRNKFINITDIPPVSGCDVVSTIDVDMQDICERVLMDKLNELNANVGVVVLMEVATGEVKAIVNLSKGKSGEYGENLNNAIRDMLEPGSTFKTASIMVALEDGKITPEDGVDTGNGVMQMHGSKMRDHNWHRGGYQYLTVPEILMVSSNIGVSSIIERCYGDNPQKFVDGLKRMSIDQPLKLQIAGEGIPNIKGPKQRYFSKTTLPWMSIGYETQLPPLNILNFYNAIANNGVMVRPRFVKAVVRNGETIYEYPTEVINPSICSERTLTQIRTILRRVVSEGLGKPAGTQRFAVSGKPGTAQISKGKTGYKGGQMNYLVSFCGYFPSEQPKYSCIVSIQKSDLPASGGTMAGSVFSKIAERVYTRELRSSISSVIDRSENAYAIPQTVSLKEVEVTPGKIPDVTGMGAKDAVYLLEKQGLKVALSGAGRVKEQSIPEGSEIIQGQTITILLN